MQENNQDTTSENHSGDWSLIALSSVGALILLVFVEESWVGDYYIEIGGAPGTAPRMDKGMYFVLWLLVVGVFLVGLKGLTKKRGE